MGIFGWSYPPGCTGTPFDEDYPCEVCNGFDTVQGKGPNQCVCPECPICGETGRAACYNGKDDHCLVRTLEQREQHDRLEEEWKSDTMWERYMPNGEAWFIDRSED